MRRASLCGTLWGVSRGGYMQREGRCAVVRQGHLMAVVGAFLTGCAVLLLVVGCAGVRSEAPEEQARSPEATASEAPRCQETRTIKIPKISTGVFTTNDLPGCPNKGGLLSGTDEN